MTYVHIMTSSNGNIFRVTGLCAGNSPGTSEFPAQRPVTRSFDVFSDLRLNKWLSKQREAGDLRRYRAHFDVIVMKSSVDISWDAGPQGELTFLFDISQVAHSLFNAKAPQGMCGVKFKACVKCKRGGPNVYHMQDISGWTNEYEIAYIHITKRICTKGTGVLWS